MNSVWIRIGDRLGPERRDLLVEGWSRVGFFSRSVDGFEGGYGWGFGY